MIFNLSTPAVKAKGPTASIDPQSGASYTNGLSGLEADVVSLLSAAISENNGITNEISVVYLDYGSIHRKVSIGDQITLALNGKDYAFDIIGFNHDDLASDTAYGTATATGKAGITFQMRDLFATTHPMKSTIDNNGGWRDSAMRTSTMATMKNYMPAEWVAVIKEVNKTTGTGDGTSSGTETVSDSCFLLSEIEVFGSAIGSVDDEGSQYAYYKAGNSKIKKRSGSADIWWTRSHRKGLANGFRYVNADGTASWGTSSGSRGVSFAFCV